MLSVNKTALTPFLVLPVLRPFALPTPDDIAILCEGYYYYYYSKMAFPGVLTSLPTSNPPPKVY